MIAEARALLRLPAEAPPPRASVWDRGLVIALVVASFLEGALREGLVLRPLQIAFGLVFVGAAAFRKVRPLAATATAFGVCALLMLLKASHVATFELWTNACSLLLPYALVRRGSGRDILIGHAFIALTYVVSGLTGELPEVSDYIGAAVVMLFPSALGAAMRFRAETRRREIEHAKLRERADIARDLHDSVAHHISAIVIQAQAGRAVLASRPEAAARTLEKIESEAARTLSELRTMVGTLREDHGGLAPQLGLGDIARLAKASDAVSVELASDLTPLQPAVEAALYRIAQESITNALRHARGLTRVLVRIAREGRSVRLTVDDDGEASRPRNPSGFGLVGMAERAELLGGTLAAGPHDPRGWRVVAILPIDGGPR